MFTKEAKIQLGLTIDDNEENKKNHFLNLHCETPRVDIETETCLHFRLQ